MYVSCPMKGLRLPCAPYVYSYYCIRIYIVVYYTYINVLTLLYTAARIVRARADQKTFIAPKNIMSCACFSKHTAPCSTIRQKRRRKDV